MARIEIAGRVCWSAAKIFVKGCERVMFTLSETRTAGTLSKTEYFRIYSNDLSLLGRINEGDHVRVVGKFGGVLVHYHSRNYDLHVWATSIEPSKQERQPS